MPAPTAMPALPAEANLLQSRLSASIVEDVNVWLNVLDNDLNIVLWNATAEKLSGYARHEVLGHGRIWEWLYPDEEYRRTITDACPGHARERSGPGELRDQDPVS